MKRLSWKKWWIVSLALVCPLASLQASTPDPGANPLLASFSFLDSTNWTMDAGYSPIFYTNLGSSQLGGMNCLIVDGPNAAILNYNVTESDSNINFQVDVGTLTMWFKPNWLGTNVLGGTGPGADARLFSAGFFTGDASYGFWGLCLDSWGNAYFCGQTNNGNQSKYLSTPVPWSTNNDGWIYLTLAYSATNSAIYANGTLLTNGSGLAWYPNTNVLSKGLFIGSDSNGWSQAHGNFSSISTYNYAMGADEVAGDYLLYSLISGPAWVSIGSGSYDYSVTPFNAVTGTGNLVTGGTNAAGCVLSTNIWFTNLVARTLTNGTQLTFLVAGGADGVLYDVFANSVLAPGSDTNRPWSWMGQAYHCVTNTLTLTNQPNISAFLILGTPQDSDSDGLTDAYEVLVSKTDPHNPDSDWDGIPDGVEVQLGTNPLFDETVQALSRANFIYDPAGRLKQLTGKRSETLEFDREGNVNLTQ